MASTRIAFIAISVVLLSSVAMAADYAVGDDKGWTVDFNYTDWAKDKVFHVGDSLVFNYDKSKHNVFKVNGSVFKDCTIPPANLALTSGKDTIQLSDPGRHWFICGISDHCANRQMKFAVNVRNDGPAAAPSAAHASVSSVYGVLVAAMVAVAAIFA